MQLTKHTDFAFRILMYLAALEGDSLTTIQTLTQNFAISKSHAMKIVNKLVHQGWVTAIRGKNGGIKLGCPSHQIPLDQVVRLMEQTLDPVNCHTPVCVLNEVCQLKGVLWEAQRHYLDHLSQFTLADMLTPKTSEAIRFIQ